MSKRLLSVLGAGGWRNVVAPDAAFSFLPFNIQKLGTIYKADPTFDLQTYANITVAETYYVDIATGSDSNDGLTEANALQNVSTAISKADASTVYVKAGIYPKGHGWDAVTPARSLEVIGYGGDVILSYHQHELVWTAADSHYTCPATIEVISVFDTTNVDTNGDMVKLVKKSNEAEVDATVNSWWWDSNVLYLHTFDSRNPGDTVYPYLTGSNGQQDDAVTYYLENLKFWGGYHAFSRSSTNAAAKTYAKNCEFSYGHSGNGFTILGAGETILQDCLAVKSVFDGYKNVELGGTYSNTVLIDCTGRSNGSGGSSAANGISRHDRGSTVVINGDYYENVGRNWHDVHAGVGDSMSWGVGVRCANSTANINFACGQDTGNPKMWLEGCISETASTGDIQSGTGATVYYRKMNPITPSQTGGGTFTAY